MRRYWFLAFAAAAAAALAVPLSASAAGNVLTVPTGSVNVGDTLAGTLGGNAVFANGNQKVTCTSSTITATVTGNPTAPGTATENVTSQTLAKCTTSGIFGNPTINSFTTNASSTCPWIASVSDSSSTNNVTVAPNTTSGCPGVIGATVSVSALGQTFSCVYNSTNTDLTGSAPVGSSTGISFSGQGFTKKSGSGLCINPVSFSTLTSSGGTASYAITDSSNGNQPVTLS